jgi:hypothetical protein
MTTLRLTSSEEATKAGGLKEGVAEHAGVKQLSG